MLQLALGLVAYGRLTERVDNVHEDVQAIKHLLLERGVNR